MRLVRSIGHRNTAIAAVLISGVLLACSSDGGSTPSAPVSSTPSTPATPTTPEAPATPTTPTQPTQPAPPAVENDLPAYDVIRPMTFQTFDGSGQVVHPDIAVTPDGWGTHHRQLIITPYPNGNSGYEMPSLYGDEKGVDWYLPTGLTNPVVHPSSGYLSDPDQLFNPETNELWMYYRQVANSNDIYLVRSPDGVHWSTPVLVVTAPNHQIVSPTVVRRGTGDWLMWSVNSGSTGCNSTQTTVEMRRSADGINWSPPETTDIQQPNMWAWHIDVEWIASRNEFWAVYNAKPSGSCLTPVLYFATSSDGLHWHSLSTPLLSKGTISQFQDVVYRSTFLYNPNNDDITFWYSGATLTNGQYVWGAAVQRRTRLEVMSLDDQQLTTTQQRSQMNHILRDIRRMPQLNNFTAP